MKQKVYYLFCNRSGEVASSGMINKGKKIAYNPEPLFQSQSLFNALFIGLFLWLGKIDEASRKYF